MMTTALIIAARRGHVEIVKKLLSQPNIDVNAINKQQKTALMEAIKKGHSEIVKELLAHKDIDISIRNSKNQTATELATHNTLIAPLFTHMTKKNKLPDTPDFLTQPISSDAVGSKKPPNSHAR